MLLGEFINHVLNPLGMELIKTRTTGRRGPTERSSTPKLVVFTLNAPGLVSASPYLDHLPHARQDRPGHVLLFARHAGFRPDRGAAYCQAGGGEVNVRGAVWRPGDYAFLMLPKESQAIRGARLLPLLEDYIYALGSGALGVVYAPAPLLHDDDFTRGRIHLCLRRSRLILLDQDEQVAPVRQCAGNGPEIAAPGDWDPAHPFVPLDRCRPQAAQDGAPARISLVTTCKGRLEQLKRTFPTLMRQDDAEYECVIADYDCPEQTAEWLMEQRNEKVIAARIQNRPFFNLSHARNIGARNATGEILVFIDADTVLRPSFLSSIRARMKPGIFLVTSMLLIGEKQAGSGQGLQGYGGIMACWKQDWEAICGFDEMMAGWGGEDDDFRRRLIALGRSPALLDMTLCKAIEHDNESRIAFYEEKQLGKSAYENVQRAKDPCRRLSKDFGLGGSGAPVTVYYGRSTPDSIQDNRVREGALARCPQTKEAACAR